jgi:hypothetical protein
MLKSRS